MKKFKIVSSALLLVLIGLVIILFTITKVSNSFGYLLLFSVGVGLFAGPMIGILLSILSNKRFMN